MARFFAPALATATAPGEELELPPDEAHHFLRVLRGQRGDAVVLFDGDGLAAAATVIEATKRAVRVRLDAVQQDDPPAVRLTVCVAPPKGDRFRWLVEKLTELNVARVQPIVTARSVTDPGLKKLDKLRGTSLAACKQCGRSRLMTIDEPVPLGEALAEVARGAGWVATLREKVGDEPDAPNAIDRWAFIGPEGGWTDDEEQAMASLAPLRFGPTVLRTETAAIAAAVRLGETGLPASADGTTP